MFEVDRFFRRMLDLRLARRAASIAVTAVVTSACSVHADLADPMLSFVVDDYDLWDGAAISDGTVVVGDRSDDENGQAAGAAYLYDVATGAERAKLLSADGDPHEWFGMSVAISGEVVIVGAPTRYNSGKVGAAYLFDAVSGDFLRKLVPSDGLPNDRFGEHVAICGPYVMVTSIARDDHGSWSGAVYIFDTTSGDELRKIVPDDGAAYDYFGGDVALSGTIAAIGASGVDDNGESNGAVYVFDVSDGRQLGKLFHDDPMDRDLLGRAVAIHGRTILAGTRHLDDFSSHTGAGYLFDALTGEQLAKLRPEGPIQPDMFGETLALYGNLALIGAPEDGVPASWTGAAYLFDVRSGQQLARLDANDEENVVPRRFGQTVALNGRTVVVGLHRNSYVPASAGMVFLYDGHDPCAGDLDRNGFIDFADIHHLLGEWGECNSCAGDLDGDLTVDFHDLLTVLGTWGSCSR